MYAWFISAISLGFLGSFHCIGMCGPLALAIPVRSNHHIPFQQLFYHLGRSISYGFLGLIVGSLGLSIQNVGWQQSLTILTGLLLIASVFLSGINSGLFVWGYQNWIRNQIKKIWERHGVLSGLWFGMLNGLLPCGFVYLALSGALVTADPIKSMFFMVFFGLGTWPMLWFLQYFGRRLSFSIWGENIRSLYPKMTVLIGLLLVLRGMGLGISLISPKFEQQKGQKVESSCCRKK